MSKKTRRKVGDYTGNPMTPSQHLVVLLQGAATAIVLDLLFYNSLLFLPLLLPLPVLYDRYMGQKKQRQRVERLNASFREALDSMGASVRAGTSASQAIRRTAHSLSSLYPSDNDLLREFRSMAMQLELGKTPEILFRELGERSGAEDIQNFAAVFAVVQASGGDLGQLLRKNAMMLGEKLETVEEVRAMISAREMEQRIMDLMPVVILGYLRLSAPGFLSVLYQGVFGRLAMTCCLLVYGAAWYLGEKLIQIRV